MLKGILERKLQVQNGITALKSLIPNLDLVPDSITILTYPRNITLIDQSGIFWSTLMR